MLTFTTRKVIFLYKVSKCLVCGGSGTLHILNKVEFCGVCNGTGLVKKEICKGVHQKTLF